VNKNLAELPNPALNITCVGGSAFFRHLKVEFSFKGRVFCPPKTYKGARLRDAYLPSKTACLQVETFASPIFLLSSC